MTKLLKLLAAALPIAAATCAFADIKGSAHDFTGMDWADGAICKPCHTPHNADVSVTGRLWAHTMSTATYSYHGGGSKPADQVTSLDGTAVTITQSDLDGASRLCMSCHDGTVALDSFMGSNHAVSDSKKMGDVGTGTGVDANLGTDLTNDHPVGYRAMYIENKNYGGHFGYQPLSAAKAKGLKFATSQYIGADPLNPKNAATGLQQDGVTALGYTQWPSVSCVTCHDVHNGTLPTEPYLLRVTNTGSAICLSCHNK